MRKLHDVIITCPECGCPKTHQLAINPTPLPFEEPTFMRQDGGTMRGVKDKGFLSCGGCKAEFVYELEAVPVARVFKVEEVIT